MEKFILRVRRKLESNDVSTSKILKYLYQLGKLPVTFSVLKETGIGKTVNGLKKHAEKEVQDKAKELVVTWKQQLSEEKQFRNDPHHERQVGQQDEYYTPEEVETVEYHPATATGGHHSADSNLIQDRDVEQISYYVDNAHSKSKESRREHKAQIHAVKGSEKTKSKGTPSKKAFSSFDFLNTPQTNNDDEGSDVEQENKEEQKMPISNKRSTMPSLPEIQLPEVMPVYRPMYRQSEDETDSDLPKKRKKANVSEIENMASNFVSRKSRTQVFSGKKYGQGAVPSLYQQCMRVLTENIDALHDTGGVPYEILEPLLTKCTPTQLSYLEECNPYFTDDTDVIWKVHCQREFKGCEPTEPDTWRDLYRVKLIEREEKLKKINERIAQSQAKKIPVRQAKLAYVTTNPKPPSHMRRQKPKYSTGEPISLGKRKGDDSNSNERKRTFVYNEDCAVPCPIPRRDASSTKKPVAPPKKTAARPMMQAALKMMKKQRGRITSAVIRR